MGAEAGLTSKTHKVKTVLKWSFRCISLTKFTVKTGGDRSSDRTHLLFLRNLPLGAFSPSETPALVPGKSEISP